MSTTHPAPASAVSPTPVAATDPKPLTEGVKAVSALATQIITLSTALVGLTVTFLKEFKPAGSTTLEAPTVLIAAWAFFLLAIAGALWTQMAVSGALAVQDTTRTPADAYAASIKRPGIVMIVAFGLGMVFLALAGWLVVR